MRLITQEILEESSTYQYLINKGRERGLDEGLRKALTKQLKLRFGAIPSPARAKLRVATRETMDRWLGQVLDAKTVEDALK